MRLAAVQVTVPKPQAPSRDTSRIEKHRAGRTLPLSCLHNPGVRRGIVCRYPSGTRATKEIASWRQQSDFLSWPSSLLPASA
jgi:hypothetical protein